MTATTPLDPERRQHRRVLARLRHHAVVGRDRPSGTGRSRSPRPPSCARSARGPARRRPTAAARRQLERRVAELDRDPALALLRQPVGVDAGERRRARSCRGRCGRAVPSVSPSATRARATSAAPTSSSVSVRGSSSSRPSSIRPIDRRVAARSRAASASGERRRPRPPGPAARAAAARRRRPSPSTARPRRRGRAASRSARAQPVVAGRQHRQHRDLAPRPLGVAVERAASPRARRATACRSAARGPAGGARARRPRRAADQQPRLRPAEQLVAREADERGARARPSAAPAARRRAREVVGQHARADVVDRPARRARTAPRSRPPRTKPSWRKFDGWARRIAPVRGRSRARSRRGACGSSSRPRPAARPPARSPPGCGSRRRSRRAGRARRRPRGRVASARPRAARARAVVDRHRRLGAGQLAQQPLDVRVARAARAGRQVELEVRVALGRPRDRLARRRRQRRAAEVRVHDHAGRVEHAPQRGPLRRRGPRAARAAQVGLALRAPRAAPRAAPRDRPRRAASATAARRVDLGGQRGRPAGSAGRRTSCAKAPAGAGTPPAASLHAPPQRPARRSSATCSRRAAAPRGAGRRVRSREGPTTTLRDALEEARRRRLRAPRATMPGCGALLVRHLDEDVPIVVTIFDPGSPSSSAERPPNSTSPRSPRSSSRRSPAVHRGPTSRRSLRGGDARRVAERGPRGGAAEAPPRPPRAARAPPRSSTPTTAAPRRCSTARCGLMGSMLAAETGGAMIVLDQGFPDALYGSTKSLATVGPNTAVHKGPSGSSRDRRRRRLLTLLGRLLHRRADRPAQDRG